MNTLNLDVVLPEGILGATLSYSKEGLVYLMAVAENGTYGFVDIADQLMEAFGLALEGSQA